MMLEVLPEVIPQRLHALVGLLARAALDHEVLPVVTHVEPQVVLAAEDLAAVVTNEVLGDVTGVHVEVELLLIRQNLVADRTFVDAELFEVGKIVLVEVILRLEADLLFFALAIAAVERQLLSALVAQVSLQLNKIARVARFENTFDHFAFVFDFLKCNFQLVIQSCWNDFFRLLQLDVLILLKLGIFRNVFDQVVHTLVVLFLVKFDNFDLKRHS